MTTLYKLTTQSRGIYFCEAESYDLAEKKLYDYYKSVNDDLIVQYKVIKVEVIGNKEYGMENIQGLHRLIT